MEAFIRYGGWLAATILAVATAVLLFSLHDKNLQVTFLTQQLEQAQSDAAQARKQSDGLLTELKTKPAAPEKPAADKAKNAEKTPLPDETLPAAANTALTAWIERAYDAELSLYAPELSEDGHNLAKRVLFQETITPVAPAPSAGDAATPPTPQEQEQDALNRALERLAQNLDPGQFGLVEHYVRLREQVIAPPVENAENAPQTSAP